MSTSVERSTISLENIDRDSDEVTSQAANLSLDDAFSTGDEEQDEHFDLSSIVGLARRSQDKPGPGNDNDSAAGNDVSEVQSISSSRNGKRIPPPLTIITEASPVIAEGPREQFEDVTLSPPATPRATTSLSPNQVPVPSSVSPRLPLTPSPLASAFPQGHAPTLRSVSPRPNYLSASSSVPVSHEIDPVRSPSPILSSQSSITQSNASSSQSKSHPRGGHHSGPSTFEKVVSKTRPSHLPPKTREEDKKHMKDREEMMKMSRVAEERRKQKMQEGRLNREAAVEDSIGIWEREIVPDWRGAMRKPELRRMWWKGIPTKLRGKLWLLAVGNGLALSKDTYRTCLARAQRALSSKTFPAESLRLIEEDILTTLPNLHIFHPEYGPMYQDLRDILCAWVVARSDEGLGYVRGASHIAAMFVINMSPDQAFVAMRNLIERHCLRSFYGGDGSEDDLEAYYRIFDTLLADGMPKVYFNFKQHQISPSLYLPDWVLPLFLNHLPFEACARIWDVIILEGDSFMFRMAIAVLGVLESRLFFPERKELLEVLRGENKAALEVAKRTGVAVDLSARYEQYGMSEEALWDRVFEMDEWWRESTWSRLIQRELPDL